MSSTLPWDLLKAETMRSLCRDFGLISVTRKKEEMIKFLTDVEKRGLKKARDAAQDLSGETRASPPQPVTPSTRSKRKRPSAAHDIDSPSEEQPRSSKRTRKASTVETPVIASKTPSTPARRGRIRGTAPNGGVRLVPLRKSKRKPMPSPKVRIAAEESIGEIGKSALRTRKRQPRLNKIRSNGLMRTRLSKLRVNKSKVVFDGVELPHSTRKETTGSSSSGDRQQTASSIEQFEVTGGDDDAVGHTDVEADAEGEPEMDVGPSGERSPQYDAPQDIRGPDAPDDGYTADNDDRGDDILPSVENDSTNGNSEKENVPPAVHGSPSTPPLHETITGEGLGQNSPVLTQSLAHIVGASASSTRIFAQIVQDNESELGIGMDEVPMTDEEGPAEQGGNEEIVQEERLETGTGAVLEVGEEAEQILNLDVGSLGNASADAGTGAFF